jgi:predicted nucleic acid-binding protein
MATKYKLRDVSQLQNRAVFVDANVLIYLFWPTGSNNWENTYASVYGRLVRQQNKLVIDFLIISEVVNRVIRTEAKKQGIINYTKQFRDSLAGRQVLSDIYLIVKNQILSQFDVTGNIFSKTDILNCLTVDSLDFLDKGILKTCRDNNFVLLTNDKDFKNADIDILTCNPAI